MLGWDGRVLAEPPTGIETEAGLAAYAELAGLTVFSAQKRIVELLRESGAMTEEPKPVTHPVKFFEKGDKPARDHHDPPVVHRERRQGHGA